MWQRPNKSFMKLATLAERVYWIKSLNSTFCCFEQNLEFSKITISHFCLCCPAGGVDFEKSHFFVFD